MNRSMFQASPFRPSYGVQPARYSIGQPQESVHNFFDDLTGGGDVGALLGDMDSLILKLPVDVAGNYSKRRDECVAKPLISQYKCLYDLFQDIKKAYKGDGSPAVTPPPTPPAPKSEFPILPIAIGAVAAAALLYVAFGRGN